MRDSGWKAHSLASMVSYRLPRLWIYYNLRSTCRTNSRSRLRLLLAVIMGDGPHRTSGAINQLALAAMHGNKREKNLWRT